MGAPHKRFVWILFACFCATLLPIFIFNLILLGDTLGNSRKVLLASQWQQGTRGITYAPTLLDTHLFKTLRLNDRIGEINTVVLGSSTAMGISQQAFPNVLSAYNYAQSAHSLSAAIDEAEWLVEHADNVTNLIIPLDWSLGWIYLDDKPVSVDLSATATMQLVQSAIRPPMLDRMRDSLSLPRIAGLLEILKAILLADNRAAAFRGYFLQDSSDDYRCADGALAKDFDITHRGTCTGFRFDGSATFAEKDPIKDAQPLIISATASSSTYSFSLVNWRGRPNPAFLRRLAVLARQTECKGGKLLLFMPPLLPGMETAFVTHPYFSPYLMQTKRVLSDWALRENIVIFDAGQSERFGCSAAEFVDPHHALQPCYDKVFAAFWSNHTHLDAGNITWPSGGLYR